MWDRRLGASVIPTGAACGSPTPALPGRFDDVAVGVAALHADVIRLVPLLDQLDAVGGEPVAEREDGVAIRQPDTEVHPLGARDRLARRTEREREAARVVEHQHAVVVAPRGAGAEAEVRLVELPRAVLVAHRDREMVHRVGC
jgi:hypothetical protein